MKKWDYARFLRYYLLAEKISNGDKELAAWLGYDYHERRIHRRVERLVWSESSYFLVGITRDLFEIYGKFGNDYKRAFHSFTAHLMNTRRMWGNGFVSKAIRAESKGEL